METYKIVRDDSRIYPMGLTVTEDRVHVSLAAVGANCSLLLYEKGQEKCWGRIPMSGEERMGDVWNLTVEGLPITKLDYCFEVDGKQVPDPYGKVLLGREHWGKPEELKKILRTPLAATEFDWEGDRPLERSYEDSIIYRIHTRGLTKHPSSQVADKGTFKAIIEKIPYMKDLGITTVELMPITEFQEVMIRGGAEGNPYGVEEPTGKLNYWGYTKQYYFAPKMAFASGREKHPDLEVKSLVKALHLAGIELVCELYFSGSESPAFVLDVVRYWVREYHLDGIHLIGNVPRELIGLDPYLSHTKLWALTWEGVDGGKQKHLAEYQEGFMIDMRRLLKGDEDQMNHLIFQSKHNPARCGVINYMANTNGFTLMDMVSYDQKHNEANGEHNQDGTVYNHSWNCGVEGPSRKKKLLELRKKQIRNAVLLLFLSQGTPLLLAGDEFGNSKSGNNNTYCQ
ncbi:MAG: alpha-amylase, partial [Hungatella sp.]